MANTHSIEVRACQLRCNEIKQATDLIHQVLEVAGADQLGEALHEALAAHLAACERGNVQLLPQYPHRPYAASEIIVIPRANA